MSCWRYTPTSKQDRFQDLLEAIRLEFLHTNLSKQNKYYIYSNIPQLLSAEVVLCMHKTTILCQFGLFRHKLTTISPSILNHFWWELYQGLRLMEGQYGGGALPCLCNEGTRLRFVLDVNIWDQSTQWQGDNS